MDKIALTIQEINNLIDALDSWEQTDLAGEMMGDLMGALLVEKMDEEGKRKVKLEREERSRLRADKQRMRKEQSTLIKAKLIQLKNKIAVSDLITVS